MNFWKDASPTKKRIIYAPHFTFTTQHRVATFPQNGQIILNLASMYPQTTWVVRPHPSFDQHIIADGIMTQQELDEYYAAWGKYGTIVREGDYFDLFRTSDCLITDCISFLADYFPSGKPVFHLRRSDQSREFNDFSKNIIGTYYQIYSNAELERLFSRVMIGGDDFMASQRSKQLAKLQLLSDETASKRVFDYLRKELKIP
jgi:CDP-glycerol glycerophosphotransferase (TagB/SpsB family)